MGADALPTEAAQGDAQAAELGEALSSALEETTPSLTTSGVDMPLALVIFGALAVGLLLGVLLENDRGRAARRELRQRRAELARLGGEAARLQQALKTVDHPESAGPALPRP